MSDRIFVSENNVRTDIADVCLNASHWDEYVTLENYSNQHQLGLDSVDFESLRFHVEETVFAGLNYFAFLIYTIMERKNDWGDAGKHQIESSFTRNVLNLAPETSITYQHNLDFAQTVKQHQTEMGLVDMDLPALEAEFDTYALSLFGKQFGIHDFISLNRVLQFIGSSWFLQGGMYGYAKEFILGTGECRKMGDYRVYTLRDERRRSPNTIVAMAAVIGEKEIFVRHESFATIFDLKWRPVSHNLQGNVFAYNSFREVSERVKRWVMHLFGVQSPEDIPQIKEAFIKDMEETVTYHELGHGVIQYHVLPLEAATLAESTKVCGENIVTQLLEFLADFAPRMEGIKGPMQNMVDVYQDDPGRARRMFWTYVSDTWFYDTSDEYMFLYTDIMSLVMVSAITEDGLDVARLDQIINGADGVESLVSWARSIVMTVSDDLTDLAAMLLYERDGEKLSFDALKTAITQQIEDEYGDEPDYDPTAYATRALFWSEVMDAILKHPQGKKKINEIMRDHEAKAISYLFKLTASDADLEQYGLNTRQYVSDRYLTLLMSMGT